VLRTKLHRPVTPSDLVSRARVLQRLDAGRLRPLTLVSAPAGYGKSTSIALWLERDRGWPSGWLSLDHEDSDLRRFLSYFLAAVQGIFPRSCEHTQDLLLASRLAPPATLAASLSNDLDAIDQPFLLVLDDYHRIDAESPVNDLLHQLLAHPPIPLHLVIVTRRDPPLQLLTLRAQGQISELRMQDLRFDAQESKALLEHIPGFTLDDVTLSRLQQDMEGWVVGLRLLSLALRRRKDRDGLLRRLHGGLQQTQEYLIQEVVNQQSPLIRDWLLRSAILDRFCEPLIQAVCAACPEGPTPANTRSDAPTHGTDNGAGDHGRFIESVAGANLFLIPLDGGGAWFRYHHQFQQLLRHELKRSMAPDAIAGLHQRASAWFEHQDLIEEAIQHAMAAGDSVGAATIIERHQYVELDQDRWYVVERWLAMLPPELIQQRPRLLLAQLWGLYNSYRMAEIPALVERVRALLVDLAVDESSMGELNVYQGLMRFLFQGDAEGALIQFEQARKRLTHSSGLWILSEIEILDAIAHQMAGKGAVALQSLDRKARTMGLTKDLMLSRIVGAEVFVNLLSGHLPAAVRAARRFSSVSKASGLVPAEGSGHCLRANAQLQSGHLDDALRGFQHAADKWGILHQKLAIEAQVGLVLSYQALRRSADATDAMQRLMALALESGDPEHIAVAQACQARLSLLQGNPEQAMDWARSFDGQAHAPSMLVWLEIPAITWFRVCVATGSPASPRQASDGLAALYQSVEALHNHCQMITIGALRCVALDKLGYRDQALEVLRQMIELAEPGGWVWPFVELGRPMAELLEGLIQRPGGSDYPRRVLDRFPSSGRRPSGATKAKPRTATTDHDAGLAEPLTRREVDVLKLLAQRLQTKEIAARLFVSPETVKSHRKNLYQKLGVKNRREAAIKAAGIVARWDDSQ